MNKLIKLISVSLFSSLVFSCSAGSGGAPTVGVAPVKVIPDARTIPTVKSLKVESDHLMCGTNYSSDLVDKQMVVRSAFNDDTTFSFVISFYDSSCSAATVGNKVATYSFSGNYSVTDLSGHVIMTVTDSKMTILAGDFPVAAKKIVDWMNSCSNMEGSFSSTENTTLSLPNAPNCTGNGTSKFPFVRNGESQESTEADLDRLVASSK